MSDLITSNRASVLVFGILISALLGGNFFFIKRLVDEIDDTNRMVAVVHEALPVIHFRLDRLESTSKQK